MRIAIFHDLPSGGAKRSLYETVKRLAAEHTLDLYTLSTGDESFCDVRPWIEQYRVFDFAPPRLFRSPWGRLNQWQRWRALRRLDHLARQVASLIDAQGYAVVFVQPCMWSQAPLLLRYLQTPTVYYCHEPPRVLYEASSPTLSRRQAVFDRLDPLPRLYRAYARRLDWEATRAARTVLVNSEFMQAMVRGIYGIAPHICYHGVDADLFRPLLGIQRQTYVLSVGAIHPPKGFAFLIESLARLPHRLRPPLRLVGNSEMAGEREALAALAARHGVELHIEVGVAHETLVRRYNEAALLVYAPHNEPFGLVPLEAMACATPVVGVAEGGVRETVVDGVTGRLVDRDQQRFADTVADLLQSPDMMSSLGRQARHYVLQQWTWDAAVDRLVGHLQAAAGREECVYA